MLTTCAAAGPPIPATAAAWSTYQDANGNWQIRTDPTHRPNTAHHRHFAGTTRSAAQWWRQGLLLDCRLIYRASAHRNSASRPGRAGPNGNGWTLFAGQAFTSIYYGDPPDAYADCADAGYILHAELLAASAATQQLTLAATYDPDQPPHDRDALASYVLQPYAPGRRDPYRWTRRAGIYYPHEGSPLYHQWTHVSPIPINAGQPLHVLLRHHCSTYGVRNFALSILAS